MGLSTRAFEGLSWKLVENRPDTQLVLKAVEVTAGLLKGDFLREQEGKVERPLLELAANIRLGRLIAEMPIASFPKGPGGELLRRGKQSFWRDKDEGLFSSSIQETEALLFLGRAVRTPNLRQQVWDSLNEGMDI